MTGFLDLPRELRDIIYQYYPEENQAAPYIHTIVAHVSKTKPFEDFPLSRIGGQAGKEFRFILEDWVLYRASDIEALIADFDFSFLIDLVAKLQEKDLSLADFVDFVEGEGHRSKRRLGVVIELPSKFNEKSLKKWSRCARGLARCGLDTPRLWLRARDYRKGDEPLDELLESLENMSYDKKVEEMLWTVRDAEYRRGRSPPRFKNAK